MSETSTAADPRWFLWRCYQATGADTSGDDPSRENWWPYAVQEVERVMREADDYADALDDAIDLLETARVFGDRPTHEEIEPLRRVALNPGAEA
jgi:hypothetical protein